MTPVAPEPLTPDPGAPKAQAGTAARRARLAEQRQAEQDRAEQGRAARRAGPSALQDARGSHPRNGGRSSARSADQGSAGAVPERGLEGDVLTVPVSRRELDPDRLAALEEERDFLLRSLRDLEREHEAGDVDEHDYRSLKDDYTARAATALRAIENRQTVLASQRRPRNPRRTWGIVALVAVLAIGLGVFVAQSSGRRGSGDSLTGDIRQSTRDRLLEAQQLLNQNPTEAVAIYDEVLAADADNTEALTYKGWLLYLASNQAKTGEDKTVLSAGALRSLSAAIEADPSYVDARIFRAILLKGLGQIEAARADLDRVPVDAVPVMMRELVDGLRADLQSAPAGSAPVTAAP